MAVNTDYKYVSISFQIRYTNLCFVGNLLKKSTIEMLITKIVKKKKKKWNCVNLQ